MPGATVCWRRWSLRGGRLRRPLAGSRVAGQVASISRAISRAPYQSSASNSACGAALELGGCAPWPSRRRAPPRAGTVASRVTRVTSRPLSCSSSRSLRTWRVARAFSGACGALQPRCPGAGRVWRRRARRGRLGAGAGLRGVCVADVSPRARGGRRGSRPGRGARPASRALSAALLLEVARARRSSALPARRAGGAGRQLQQGLQGEAASAAGGAARYREHLLGLAGAAQRAACSSTCCSRQRKASTPAARGFEISIWPSSSRASSSWPAASAVSALPRIWVPSWLRRPARSIWASRSMRSARDSSLELR